MARVLEISIGFLTCLGVALLVCGLLLTPANFVMGAGPIPTADCPGASCDTGCAKSTDCNGGCNAAGVAGCASLCSCKYTDNSCVCGNK